MEKGLGNPQPALTVPVCVPARTPADEGMHPWEWLGRGGLCRPALGWSLVLLGGFAAGRRLPQWPFPSKSPFFLEARFSAAAPEGIGAAGLSLLLPHLFAIRAISPFPVSPFSPSCPIPVIMMLGKTVRSEQRGLVRGGERGGPPWEEASDGEHGRRTGSQRGGGQGRRRLHFIVHCSTNLGPITRDSLAWTGQTAGG